MTRHEWRERSEDGELRYVRATVHGRTWTLQSRLKSEEEWTNHDPIPRADLETLRELIWRKYQRRRASFEDVQQLDALLEEES
jgi:hypothetical protein